MINTNKDQYRLNLIPVFGDLGTIILGFFILIVIILLNELKESEKSTEIGTNKYFISKKHELSPDDSLELYTAIKTSEKYYPEISRAFKNGKLISLRIEGHTDPQEYPPNYSERIKNNYELSFFRAQTIGNIFNRIIDNDSSLTDSVQQQNFKDKINLVGFGSSRSGEIKIFTLSGELVADHSDVGFRESEDGITWETFDRKNKENIIKDQLTEKEAKDYVYNKQRRVVVTPVTKGI